MAIWSFGDPDTVEFAPATQAYIPLSAATPFVASSPTDVPRLEVGCLDSPPLSHSLRFSSLFSDLDVSGDGSHTHQSSLDMSYDIQNFTNIKDIDPEWDDDDVDELVVMSPKLPSTLSTIPEVLEPSPVMTYTTTLSDFELLDATNVKDQKTKVMLCRKKKTGKIYKIRCQRIYDHFPWAEQDILETLRDLEAPFLPRLRSSFREDGCHHLVLDYSMAHSLRNIVEKDGSLGSQRVFFYASEILVALSSLHAVGIMHRNLNPDDLLLDAQGHMLITNFEFADFIAGSGTNSTAVFSGPRVQDFQAPEILLSWAHDAAVDCWGFGMLLYFMYFGKHPFQDGNGNGNMETLKKKIIHGSISTESLRLIHPQVRDLITRCLERNPRVRSCIESIKKHEYFCRVSWSKVSAKQVEVPHLPGPADFLPDPDFFKKFETSCSDSDRKNGTGKNKSEGSSLSGDLKRFMSTSPSISLSDVRESTSVAAPPHVTEGDSNPQCSGSATIGHPQLSRANVREEIIQTAVVSLEPMLDFWDALDQEDRASLVSTTSAEFGENLGRAFCKAPKLRKHRSSIYPRQLFLNFSTSSFHPKLRRKQKSTSVLCEPPASERTAVLPTGIKHIGSGIGFNYNLPVASGSKVSICTSTPRSCYNLFQSRFSVSALGIGLKTTICGSKAKSGVDPVAATDVSCDNETPQAMELEGETSTFLRDMYQSTSWIFPPPTSLPSPMALTTGANVKSVSVSTTPMSDDGPFTPATMVCEDEVRRPGVMEKGMGFEGHAVNVVEEKSEADLTLRLVTPSGLRLSLSTSQVV